MFEPPTGSATPSAELIMVGSELLRGVYADSNGHFLARSLSLAGVALRRTTLVRDIIEEVASSIREALKESSLVIVCGGLGPTVDDLTREAISEATGITLHFCEEIAKFIQERFAKRGIQLPENNLRQAEVPDRGGYFPNPHGTAPGLYFEMDNALVIALPGPPRELIPMFEESILPFLIQRGLVGSPKPSRLLRVAGIPESQVDQRLRVTLLPFPSLVVSLLARPNLVDVTLFDDDEKELELAANAVKKELGTTVYTQENNSIEAVIGDLLSERFLTLGVAESCTGGMIGAAITNVPGSSLYFTGGVVSYSNEVKSSLLGVPDGVLKKYGAVSAQTAHAMAVGVRRVLKSGVGLSVTGIAGPDGGTKEKPVGLVFIACSIGETVQVEKNQLIGNRGSVRIWATQRALDLLRRCLLAP